MKLTNFFVCGALACVLTLLELPPLNGKYLLVELEGPIEEEDTAAANEKLPPMQKPYPIPFFPAPGGKTIIKCNNFAYVFP